jgi:hypothetical protein
MVELPPQLIKNLSFPEAQLLRRVLGVVGEELDAVYRAAVRHHRPRDNATIFGQRTWVHSWAALEDRRDELGEAEVIEHKNSSYLRVGRLKVGIHKLGHGADDDIHSCFPEGSDTKRSYGQNNSLQLALFDSTPDSPLAEDAAFALRELTIGHFGNPKEGLVKWYVGAYIYDDAGRPRWAWITRQKAPAATPPPVTPYSEKQPEPVEVPPRRGKQERRGSEGSQGA